MIIAPRHAPEIATSRTARPALDVPLLVESRRASSAPQPISVGVPFPKGMLPDPSGLALLGLDGRPLPLQREVLMRWSDGSVRWLLVDSILGPLPRGLARLGLVAGPDSGTTGGPRPEALRAHEEGESVLVEAGVAAFRVERGASALFRASLGGREVLDPAASGPALTDRRGRRRAWRVDRVSLETSGPVRSTVRVTGRFEGAARCRFSARLSFYAGLGLVRVRTTLHNTERARHRGGLWDLGDPGSFVFRGLSIGFVFAGAGGSRVVFSPEAGEPPREAEGGTLEIYQDSSGGDNWDSRVHVDRQGRVPCAFRGYRAKEVDRERRGLRASPTVAVEGPLGRVVAAVPEFWEQFPKAIEADGRGVVVRPFPGQSSGLFELQGGERKTDTFWLDFAGATPDGRPLDWAHRPVLACCTPDWYAEADALPHALPAREGPGGDLEGLLAMAVDPEVGLAARREVIDEYGWRNFGEVHADHEAAYFEGPGPVVSHFNNQYDVIQGAILQYFRTGDARWSDLFDPLARHVMDIDIYHAARDRPDYAGGPFWHTDHYRDARTATHRCYSRGNSGASPRGYGGGPCAEHNYTSGLRHYYLLTGDRDARDAVTGLADWVVRMDDGGLNVLGLVDDGPTGLASRTFESDYHGPGRGIGNSINALLDAWLTTGRRPYLDEAESLIRRAVHPCQDVAALDLLDVERRWSYTVFLSVLARYLGIKAEAGELGAAYAYARESLLAFASWMLEHEVPYFDRPERLDYPTETWAAQELRKANVLRLAAEHADEPLRGALLRRGDELGSRAWDDLRRFESRGVARSLALVMAEGPRDDYFRSGRPAIAPRPDGSHDWGPLEPFLPQKARVLALIRTPRGLTRAIGRLADPRGLWKFLRRRRQRPPEAR